VRRGAAWIVERHQVAAWSLPWLRSRWQRCHRRASLGCQAANAGPQQGARRVPAGRLRGRGDRGCPNAFRAVRPFPVRIASGSAGVPSGGDGVRPDMTEQAVSGRLSDHGVHCGRRTRPRGHWTGTRLADVRASSMGAAGHDGRLSMLVTAVVGRRRACAFSSCPVRARMGGQRGWPWPAGQAHGRTLGGAGVRRLAVAVRTGSVPIGWPVTLNWDVRPTGRSRGPPCPSPGQPLPGVRRRNWSAAETVSRRVSGGRTLAEAGGQPDCGHVRHATGGDPRGAH
jgi:hypothetical protein